MVPGKRQMRNAPPRFRAILAQKEPSMTDTVWPLPKFHFSVEFDGIGEIAFQEVSGLDTEAQVIEYRAGNSKVFSAIKMPGLMKTGNVTLKKGVFANDNRFWDWFNQIKMNTITRRTVTISLLDETGAPTMVWKLANAWPTKIAGTDLKSDGNEVAIETIEIAHEGLTIENG
jgi:phage tail-like protein